MFARFGCVFVLGLFSSGIFADPVLEIQTGQLVGATGVDVDGILYDVAFVEGSCVTLIAGCDGNGSFLFTQAGAVLAAQALIDQIFSLAPYTTNPSLISGCSSTVICYVITPFALVPGGVDIARVMVRALISEKVQILAAWNKNVSTGTLGKSVYAVWSLSAVPLPAAVWLFGSALVGLGLVGRRRKQFSGA